MSNNQYWAFDLNGEHTEELKFHVVAALLDGMDTYRVFQSNGDVTAFVHPDALNATSKALSASGDTGITLRDLKEFVSNVNKYSVIAFGETDETYYVVVVSEHAASIVDTMNAT